MLRKILLACCLALLTLGTLAGCTPASGSGAPAGTTTPAD
jgi:hypothetical protein